jgi:FAD/FMN-containing dehydrogenase
MEIALHPLEMVYGGNLVYPAAQAPELLRRFRDWIATTPEELTTSIALMNLPPVEDIPEPLRGQSVVMVRGCYCGPVEEGEAHFAKWRAETEPLMDMVGPLPFGQVAMISMDPEGPVPGLSSGTWLADLSDETLDTLASRAFVAQGPPPLMITEVRHVAGAKGRVDPAGSAMGHRDAALVLQLVGMVPTPEIKEMVRGYMDGFLAALDGHKVGVYPNFLEGEEAVALMRDGFAPETAARLRAIKAQVDPDNLFRYAAW